MEPTEKSIKTRGAILFGPLPPPYGGVSVFMSAMYRAALEHGIRVWSYNRTPGDTLYANARRISHRRLGHIWALLIEGRNARIADSTHFHLEYPNNFLLPLWVAVKSILNFEWVKILHDGSLPARYASFSRSQKRLFKAAIRNIDEFVVVSRELEKWLREVTGFENKISICAPLLPVPSDWVNEPLAEELSKKLDRFSTYKKRVCTIGFSIASYGFHHVASAIEELRADNDEDIGLFIIDGGSVTDTAYKESLLAGRNWIELAENVPHPNVGQIIGASDVFVRASEHEGFGLSRIEALWCGKPVIATRVGETRGMLLYDFDDVDQLRRQLRSIFEGKIDIDVAVWAAVFHAEAQENLKNYLRLISGEDTQ